MTNIYYTEGFDPATFFFNGQSGSIYYYTNNMLYFINLDTRVIKKVKTNKIFYNMTKNNFYHLKTDVNFLTTETLILTPYIETMYKIVSITNTSITMPNPDGNEWVILKHSGITSFSYSRQNDGDILNFTYEQKPSIYVYLRNGDKLFTIHFIFYPVNN